MCLQHVTTLQCQDPGGQPSAPGSVLSEQNDHTRLAAILQQDQDNLQQVYSIKPKSPSPHPSFMLLRDFKRD